MPRPRLPAWPLAQQLLSGHPPARASSSRRCGLRRPRLYRPSRWLAGHELGHVAKFLASARKLLGRREATREGAEPWDLMR